MAVVRSGPEWDELGRIDYFLDQLARAVERGEVPRESYDRLAPRYLERRTEITRILDRRAGRAAAEATARPAASTSASPVSTTPVSTTPAVPPVAYQTQPAPQREPVQVPWTTVLTFAGAFLVVVAAAIFAIATWDVFSVGFKLVFMGGLTAAFYGAAEFVDRKLELRAGAYALATVSAAMLLFDGWIVIDGYNIEDAWPWAFLLLICSLVYWAMEFRLTGGFFGIVGAAAQIGWWWLMAAGLGWTTIWRVAGMVVIAIIWDQVSRRVRGGEPITAIGKVLGWGAVGIVTVGTIVAVGDTVLIGHPTWSEVAATAIIALATVAVIWPRQDIPTSIAAAGSLPFAITVVTLAIREPGWGVAGVMLAAALGYVLIELFNRTWVFAGLAVLAELGFWLLALDLWGVSDPVFVGAIAALGASWIAAAALGEGIDPSTDPELAKLPGTASIKLVVEVAGWLTLAISTVLVPVSLGEVMPLVGQATSLDHAWLASWATILWLAAGLLRRQPLALPVAVFATFYTLAAFLGEMFPDWYSASYAAAFMGLVLVWSQTGTWIGPAHDLRKGDVTLGAHALAVLVPIGGLSVAFALGTIDEWPTVILLGAALLYWIADVLRNRTSISWAPLGAAAVGIASAAVLVLQSAEEAALAAGGASLLLLLLAGALRLVRTTLGAEDTRAVALGASFAATFAVPVQLAVGSSGQVAATLALIALVWAVAVWVAGIGLLSAAAGILALGAAYSSLDALQASAWFTVGVSAFFAFGLLAPSWWFWSRERRSESPAQGTVLRASAYSLSLVAAAAAVAPIFFALMVDAAGQGVEPWVQVSDHLLVTALVVLGGWLIASGRLFDIEVTYYLGPGVIVGALLYELDLLGVDTPYIATTITALYLAAMGYLYSRLDPAREVPMGTDLASAAVGIGLPALWVLSGGSQAELLIDAFWTIGIAVFAIGIGIVLKVRTYFFGGVALIIWVAFWRSLSFLVAYWWLALGMIGVAMLVIALTWERQRMVLAQTQARVRTSFEGWR